MNSKAIKLGLCTVAFSLLTLGASAQTDTEHSNANVRLGQKALLDGDFKSAAAALQKALPAEAKDPNVLYMLGYSQFQTGDFTNASESFEKVVALDPTNGTAYYYKAKASNNLAINMPTKLMISKREQLLKSAIVDYSKAITLNPQDVKLYQNRALAHRDLAILVGTAGASNYSKAAATEAYNLAITDFEKVLTFDNSRKDINTEIKKSKVYRDNLK
ncbi:tetratricopeptide repeat protein [Sphingobacteriaceae bacterium WQ 2009]|uniref:Tetratricopeptide repeat protein n=1 Tax=Rhinopithecimicrobium faecis TaxID=2820698 RepID=A0A8T4HC66_9SPHI|nr:tetratricopeptide repeat protein [Sphingobacteriaceae bacterium WQ 2009]